MLKPRSPTLTTPRGPTLYQLESLGAAIGFGTPPRDLQELRVRLMRRRLEAADSLAAVAHFEFEQPLDVAFGTNRSIADGCSASTTAILRLPTMLRFEGFSEIREFFHALLRSSPHSTTKPSDDTPLFGAPCGESRFVDEAHHSQLFGYFDAESGTDCPATVLYRANRGQCTAGLREPTL